MDRRAFLSVVGSLSLTGCLGFFGPREAGSASDEETPDSTGYDDTLDPGFDGDPLRIVVFDVPGSHPVGQPLPVKAKIRNEDTRARDASVTIALRELGSDDLHDRLQFSGSIDAGSMLSLDVQLEAPSAPGTYRVTLGDPDAPAAAKEVSVE